MRPLIATSLLTGAAAAVGSLGSRPDQVWYRELDKPPWQPPAAAFPLVWTPLYGLIAWGTGRMIAAGASGRGRVLALAGTDLAVNAGWSWVFFVRRSPAGGLATIALLDVLNLALLGTAARRDRTAAAALTPYVAWVAFATALNAAIWHRNRSRPRH